MSSSNSCKAQPSNREGRLALERADRTAPPGTRAEHNYVADVMRRNGFSEQDIASPLGLPMPATSETECQDES
jgi:hypothetical protein